MGKIVQRHLERKACVYVRQSSLAQVHHHKESTARQYNLRARAVELGWREEQVEVIDQDQGESGASSENRDGFKRLVSEVALGQVGAVLGLEASRLARSCTDWYRLLEVAALSGTLIVDADGVYDPKQYNDRLLLGLKGTMSEAELHFLKQRMVGGRRHKAHRGDFRIRLPVGYVWVEEEIRMDPEERVRDTLHLFFRSFERLGTAMAVARYFEEQRQEFPRRDGWGTVGFGLSWGRLSIARAVSVLRNPVYAGIYAYDRHNATEVDPEDPAQGGRIWIEGSHAGYITVEQYERHVARLISNRGFYRGMRNRGSAREGGSLLQGIVLCAECGRPMNVAYRNDGSCDFACRDSHTRRVCRRIPGRDVERVVEKVILEALNHAELELAVGALEKVAERAAELDRQWRKRIESARYEADRAARRYYAVEPENRLVVRTLESEWNERLEEVERLEKEYEELKRRPPLELSGEQRRKILALSQDLPRLWNAPTTKNSQRKQVVRLLIEDVTLRFSDEPQSIEVSIRWKTGVVSRHQARRRVASPHKTVPATVARIQELLEQKTDGEIAEILNREGHRTGHDKPFDVKRVENLRRSRGLRKSP
jgi:DNA invertase Pin-like site-specific DNA recombinase